MRCIGDFVETDGLRKIRLSIMYVDLIQNHISLILADH